MIHILDELNNSNRKLNKDIVHVYKNCIADTVINFYHYFQPIRQVPQTEPTVTAGAGFHRLHGLQQCQNTEGILKKTRNCVGEKVVEYQTPLRKQSEA